MALIAMGALAVGVAGAGGAPTKRQDSITLDGPPGSVAPKCTKRARAVSGGFDGPGFNPDISEGPRVRPLATERRSKREWSTTGINEGFGDAGDLVGYAYCEKRKDFPRLKRVAATTSVPAEETGSAIAKCPRGEAVSGGFRTRPDQLTGAHVMFAFESMRDGRRSWKASAYNVGPSTTAITTYAYCARKKLGLKERSAEVAADGAPGAFPQLTATARCKRGARAISGGFTGADDSPDIPRFAPFRSVRQRDGGWRAAAQTFLPVGTSVEWTAIAYCLKAG